MRTVIIGNGIAGNEVAFFLRELNNECNITIISAEDAQAYNPCALPYLVGGVIQKSAVFLKEPFEYEEKNIHLVLDNKAISIDPKEKVVIAKNGQRYGYDKLVLALGGSQSLPPIKGLNKKGVFNCKQIDQAEALLNHHGKSAVVVGSGAIGIEIAEALKNKNYEVTIIELFDWILPTMFDKPAAHRLENKLKNCGINILKSEKVLTIEGSACVLAVRTDKRVIPCDTIVIATGIVPRIKLAKSAGIDTARGILVNDKMETNVKDVYACGDCVEVKEALHENEYCLHQLKHNAIGQAHFVARNIMGENAIYLGAYSLAKIHFFGTYAAAFGKTLKVLKDLTGIEVIERGNENDFLRIVVKEGTVLGAQAIGKFTDGLGLLIGAMWRQDDIRELETNWKKINMHCSPHQWMQRKIGHLVGLDSQDFVSTERGVNINNIYNIFDEKEQNGKNKILILEDDELILNMGRINLEKDGHT